MEKIIWFDLVRRNDELLRRIKGDRNIPHKMTRKKANWIGHIFRRNGLTKQVTEGKIAGRIEVTE
jgi:transposase